MTDWLRKERRHGASLGVCAVVAVALIGAACGGDDDGGDRAAEEQTHQSEEAAGARPSTYGHGANPAEATRVVELKLSDDFRFDPPSIEVKKGETITFRVTNVGQLPHELTIGGPNAQELHELEMASMDMGDAKASMEHEKTDMPKEHTSAAKKDDRMAELDRKAAAFDGVHVLPGETKELAWTFTGKPPLLGCHIPGHWNGGMRAEVVFVECRVLPDCHASWPDLSVQAVPR
jgi:uncharacterized cupredoxin-like copper-binding protein